MSLTHSEIRSNSSHLIMVSFHCLAWLQTALPFHSGLPHCSTNFATSCLCLLPILWASAQDYSPLHKLKKHWNNSSIPQTLKTPAFLRIIAGVSLLAWSMWSRYSSLLLRARDVAHEPMDVQLASPAIGQKRERQGLVRFPHASYSSSFSWCEELLAQLRSQ